MLNFGAHWVRKASIREVLDRFLMENCRVNSFGRLFLRSYMYDGGSEVVIIHIDNL